MVDQNIDVAIKLLKDVYLDEKFIVDKTIKKIQFSYLPQGFHRNFNSLKFLLNKIKAWGCMN